MIYFCFKILRLVYNYFVNYIPSHILRNMYLRLCRCKIGRGSRIDMGCYMTGFFNLSLGNHVHINHGTIIQCCAPITVGNNVSVSFGCRIISGGHDANSPYFAANHRPITIGDYVWIGVGATILGGKYR